MKLIYFKSYSCDDYYMLVDDDFKPGTAEEFCKNYLDYEYEGWAGSKFKYNAFRTYPVLENGLCIIPLSFEEIDVINTCKMKKNDCIFSDFVPYLYNGGRMYHDEDIPALKAMTKKEIKELKKKK